MSEIKFVGDEFLEKEELNRFKDFITDKGYIQNLLNDTAKYGFVSFGNKSKDSFSLAPSIGLKLKFLSTNNFFIDENGDLGTNKNLVYAIKRCAEEAVENLPNTIFYSQDPNDIYVPFSAACLNVGYWIRATYLQTPIEKGICSISTDGTVTGVGTEFTQILRNQISRFPSVVQFINSESGNTYEYTVAEVSSDTQITLTGDSGMFTVESGLMYKVIGTFTPGYVPPSEDKDIFQYDSVLLEFIKETVSNTEPTNFITNPDTQFCVGRVLNNGTTISYEDKRRDFYQSKSFSEQSLQSINPDNATLFGVESIKNPNLYTAQDFKEIVFGWGFRSDTYSIDPENYKITITSGLGGRFTNSGVFASNDFDGWRLYNDTTNKYYTIQSSIKSSSSILLYFDNLNPDDFDGSTNLYIVPDCEEIEIKLYPNSLTQNENSDGFASYHHFPIKRGFGIIHPPIDSISKEWKVYYRFKTGNEYTPYLTLQDNTTGYFNETAFDDEGLQINNNRTGYVGGVITIDIVDGSNFVGDKAGVAIMEVTDSDITLTIGESPVYIVLEGSISFSSDRKIKIRKKGTIGNKQPFSKGNHFIIDNRATILGSYGLSIVVLDDDDNDDYTLKQISRYDLNRGNFNMHCFALDISISPQWKMNLIYHQDNSNLSIQSQTEWTTSTLNAGWIGRVITGALRIRRDLDRCYLDRGVQTALVITEYGGLLTTLPVGYRPPGLQVFPVQYQCIGSNEYGLGWCTINTNGNVLVFIPNAYVGGATTNVKEFSFSGISFFLR